MKALKINLTKNISDLTMLVTKLEKFFEENNGYNDEMLEKIGITKDELRDYADLGLGKQIRDCIVKTGSCSFEAEL